MMQRIFLIALMMASVTLLSGQVYSFYAVSNDQNNAKPVYLCELDSSSGAMTAMEEYAGVVKGNYLALSPNHRQLLVTSMNSAKNQGGLVQYNIAEDGTLSLSHSELVAGGVPCHVSFTPDSAHVLSAYYGDDKIALNPYADGHLDPESDRITKEDQARGHCILAAPSGKFVYAVFLGLNKVYSYAIADNSFVANATQEYFSLPDGYGPRHLAFHPDSNRIYIINEYHSSVTACSYDTASGALSQIQDISMLPDGYTGDNTGAAIRIHPNGKFLYASNRGHNSIAAFHILEDGRLAVIEQEGTGIDWPRDFNFSPDGSFLLVANQKGNNITSYRIDITTGELTSTGQSWSISAPMSIVFLPEEEEEVVDPTGILPVKNPDGTKIKVFPNPATLEIRLSSPDGPAIVQARLYDLRGQLVREYSGSQLSSLDISPLAAGSYILVLHSREGEYAQQIVIH